MSELKPCPKPWCGGPAEWTASAYQVGCMHCGLTAYCCDTEEEARAIWNAPSPRITRLEADRVELIERLEGLIDDEPCRLDHSGNCQAHFITSPCEMAQARKTLSRLQGGSDGE